MHKSVFALALAAATCTAMAVPTGVAAQEAKAAAKAYSVKETKVGVLLDDPKAAAILKELIPTVYANDMFQSMGRDNTLAGIQQYEPAALTDETLAKIQAAFDALGAKK